MRKYVEKNAFITQKKTFRLNVLVQNPTFCIHVVLMLLK
jgi:hypothetical protein